MGSLYFYVAGAGLEFLGHLDLVAIENDTRRGGALTPARILLTRQSFYEALSLMIGQASLSMDLHADLAVNGDALLAEHLLDLSGEGEIELVPSKGT